MVRVIVKAMSAATADGSGYSGRQRLWPMGSRLGCIGGWAIWPFGSVPSWVSKLYTSVGIYRDSATRQDTATESIIALMLQVLDAFGRVVGTFQPSAGYSFKSCEEINPTGAFNHRK